MADRPAATDPPSTPLHESAATIPGQDMAAAAAAAAAPEELLPPPPVSQAPRPVILRSGSRVRLKGLTGRPDLNDEIGVARKYNDEAGRWVVRVSSSKEHVRLKPANLEPLPSYYGLGYIAVPTAGDLGIPDDDDGGFSAAIKDLRDIASCKQPAANDVKYWAGATNSDTGAGEPWRNGTDDSPITDPTVVAREEKSKAEAEEQDHQAAPTPELRADRLRGFGVQVDFLLYLTLELDLWKWKTWEVVQFVVKPATEQHGNRCRFAELPLVKRFSGPATVFASHCWGGYWGDLVAAVCAGADTRRVAWIDVFAVRQWPGNGADLDFRGVIARSTAAIVAVAPVEGTLTAGFLLDDKEIAAFVASDEYNGAAKVLPFCRLWCLVEIFAAIQHQKGLIFRGSKVASVTGRRVHLPGWTEKGSREKQKMLYMLHNCSMVVDLSRAACTVATDRDREMAMIERDAAAEGGLSYVNRTVASAILAGFTAMDEGLAAVDNFVCGETEALEALPVQQVAGAVFAACASGDVGALLALLGDGSGGGRGIGGGIGGGDRCVIRVPSGIGGAEVVLSGLSRAAAARKLVMEHISPLSNAAGCGRVGIVEVLLGMAGMAVNRATSHDGCTPLYKASERGYSEVVRLLLAHPATNVNQARTDDGRTPLYAACAKGHEDVVRLLLAHAATDVNQARTDTGSTPLWYACQNGHEAVVELLLAHPATNVNQAKLGTGTTPFFIACQEGHEDVVRLLLGHAATDVNQAKTDSGSTPLCMASQRGHEAVVELLLSHPATNVNQARTSDGVAPLFAACQGDHKGVVRLLLSRDDTDVNQTRTLDGSTPLIIACQNSDEGVVRLLLEKGADATIETTKPAGITARRIAEQRGNAGVLALLRSPIPIGTHVELRGLQAKPEMNGHQGVVIGFDGASGRCKVEIEEGGGSFKLKPRNLKRI